MDIYTRNRDRAHSDIIAAGGALMRLPIDKHLALNETGAVFVIDITDVPGLGVGVRLTVDGWPCEYWPALTYERAVAKAWSV